MLSKPFHRCSVRFSPLHVGPVSIKVQNTPLIPILSLSNSISLLVRAAGAELARARTRDGCPGPRWPGQTSSRHLHARCVRSTARTGCGSSTRAASWLLPPSLGTRPPPCTLGPSPSPSGLVLVCAGELRPRLLQLPFAHPVHPRHLLLLGRGGAGGAPAPRPSAWLTNEAYRRVKWSFHLSV